MNKIPLSINGLKVEASFYQDNIDDIFIPLLTKLAEIQKRKKERIIIFIAAAPGAGKSTLAAYLEYLQKDQVQAIDIDGFHHYDEYLRSHFFNGKPLKAIKGAPETFDVERLEEKLAQLKYNDITWPIYSRILHDPIEDQIIINKDIILLEGNYLLLDSDKWRDLKKYSDLTIFIRTKKEDLKEDLIKRKMQSGMDLAMTLKHYQNVDEKNADLVNKCSVRADITLSSDPNRHYTILDDNGFFQ